MAQAKWNRHYFSELSDSHHMKTSRVLRSITGRLAVTWQLLLLACFLICSGVCQCQGAAAGDPLPARLELNGGWTIQSSAQVREAARRSPRRRSGPATGQGKRSVHRGGQSC